MGTIKLKSYHQNEKGNPQLCESFHGTPRVNRTGVMFWTCNLLTPRSDQHVTSPYSIDTISSKQVARILKLINYKIS